jgi:hypothetical protein
MQRSGDRMRRDADLRLRDENRLRQLHRVGGWRSDGDVWFR